MAYKYINEIVMIKRILIERFYSNRLNDAEEIKFWDEFANNRRFKEYVIAMAIIIKLFSKKKENKF